MTFALCLFFFLLFAVLVFFFRANFFAAEKKVARNPPISKHFVQQHSIYFKFCWILTLLCELIVKNRSRLKKNTVAEFDETTRSQTYSSTSYNSFLWNMSDVSEFPKTVIQKIVKKQLSNFSTIENDAKIAFSKAAVVFLMYLTFAITFSLLFFKTNKKNNWIMSKFSSSTFDFYILTWLIFCFIWH